MTSSFLVPFYFPEEEYIGFLYFFGFEFSFLFFQAETEYIKRSHGFENNIVLEWEY